MTDYANMEAGLELDALVAECVMGWTWRDSTNEMTPDGVWEPAGKDAGEWSPSTDPAAAFEVLDCFPRAEIERFEKGGMWRVRFWYGELRLQAYSEELPLAICRAALMAKENET